MKPLSFLFAVLGLAMFAGCQESFDARLTREAREITQKHCPKEPEPGTRLDSVSYEAATRTITFWYSLSANNEAALKDKGALMHEMIARQLRSDIDYKACKDEGIDFRYVYRSQTSGSLVYETRVKKDEYN